RLHGEDDDIGLEVGGQAVGSGDRGYVGLAGEGGRARTRLDDDIALGEAPCPPAAQQRAAHLAAAGQQQRRDRRRRGVAHASPTGSIIADAMASSAALPPQTTSWKAG